MKRILIALVLMTSCVDGEFYPASEVFTVREMMQVHKSDNGYYKYILESTNGDVVFFIKTQNFYEVGDTLVLSRKN